MEDIKPQSESTQTLEHKLDSNKIVPIKAGEELILFCSALLFKTGTNGRAHLRGITKF